MCKDSKLCKCGCELAYIVYDMYYCSVCDQYYIWDGKRLSESDIEAISYAGKYDRFVVVGG